MTTSITNIKAGNILEVTYADGTSDNNEFLGFTDLNESWSTTPRFDSWKEVKEFYFIKSIKQAEYPGLSEDGKRIAAIFRSEDGQVWAAYPYNGRYVMGTSADRFSMELLAESFEDYTE